MFGSDYFGARMGGVVPVLGQPFRSLPGGMSIDELSRRRNLLCEIASRYPGGRIPAWEDTVVQDAIDGVVGDLNSREQGQLVNWAKVRCPELGDLMATLSQLKVQDLPMEPSEDPFKKRRPPKQPMPEYDPVPSVDTRDFPSVPTSSRPRPTGKTSMVPTGGAPTPTGGGLLPGQRVMVNPRTINPAAVPTGSAFSQPQRDPGRYSWTPEAARAAQNVPSCPAGQFWDGRQCRGAVGNIPSIPGGAGAIAPDAGSMIPGGAGAAALAPLSGIEGTQVRLRGF